MTTPEYRAKACAVIMNVDPDALVFTGTDGEDRDLWSTEIDVCRFVFAAHTGADTDVDVIVNLAPVLIQEQIDAGAPTAPELAVILADLAIKTGLSEQDAHDVAARFFLQSIDSTE